MNILISVLTVLLVTDCLVLLGLILVQRGRGGGLAGAFGGLGGGESAFGTRAASTAKKATAILAALFILLSAALYMMKGRKPELQGGGPAAPIEESRPLETENE